MKKFMWLLALMFIGLKVTHHIEWSWWVVLSPLWGGFLLCWISLFFAVLIIERFGSPADRLKLRMKGWL